MTMPSPLTALTQLDFPFDAALGALANAPLRERRLSSLSAMFADTQAFAAALAQGDPTLYTTAAVGPADGPGDLHVAIARLMPGRIGAEYFMTAGHFHAWRPAAEWYVGLSGSGVMLLESEDARDSRVVPLTAHALVYIPGHTAHRTINTGTEPLVYLGIFPAQAGHDYGAIAVRNFRTVVVDVDGVPTHRERSDFLSTLPAA